MNRVVVDPITRIEGHLRIEAEVDGGAVRDAWSSSTMFRGIEIILRGRDPLKSFVNRGQLGPFANAYCGHPGYKLPPEANLMATAHYLEALEFQRRFIRIHAILGPMLLPLMHQSDQIVIVHAIRSDGVSGSVVRIEGDAVGPAVSGGGWVRKSKTN